MVSTLKNDDGYIYAFAEWRTTNDQGVAKDNGEYLYIDYMWIHDDYRQEFRILNKLINKIDVHENTKSVKYVYWETEKFGNRLSPTYIRSRLSRMGEKDENI